MYYDTIIVGAGIAGLRVGIETLKAHPEKTCCILEKYGYTGGRIVTFKKGRLQWEGGAGRIATSHKKVLGLLKEYGVATVPLNSTSDYIENRVVQPSNFTELHDVYLAPLRKLPSLVLRTHTLKQLLDKTFGHQLAKNFMMQFPYYAEMHTLRADCALDSFDAEMRSDKGFVVCPTGLSSLMKAMESKFLSLVGTLKHHMELKVVRTMPPFTQLICSSKTDIVVFHTSRCVLALDQGSLRTILGISSLPVLRKLRMIPLLRIYAVFPVHKGRSWFSDLKKVVTNDPLRYIIPIRPDKGVIMISYTEGADAAYWLRYDDTTVVPKLMDRVRRLFPDLDIPDPTFVKMHKWHTGCTYWLPGDYSVEEESRKSLNPLKGVYLCNESFAVKQCWIESALEQADRVLQIL